MLSLLLTDALLAVGRSPDVAFTMNELHRTLPTKSFRPVGLTRQQFRILTVYSGERPERNCISLRLAAVSDLWRRLGLSLTFNLQKEILLFCVARYVS